MFPAKAGIHEAGGGASAWAPALALRAALRVAGETEQERTTYAGASFGQSRARTWVSAATSAVSFASPSVGSSVFSSM